MKNRKLHSFLAWLACPTVLCVTIFSCQDPASNHDLVVEEGLQAHLIVQEPLVIDPVAFAFDETGLLYVVEDRGYPDPPEGGTPEDKVGRIVQLRDTDKDGKYDQRFEFVTDLTYPNGILPWKGGVFVTCSPDIFYFKDTDGDGIADVKEVVLTGFKDTKTSQLRASHPTLGLDGWIYLTSGLNGGDVYAPKYPDRDTLSFTASDSRFHPETYAFELVGGRSQFGLTFDHFGHRFGCSNRHPVMQTVLEPKYLNRNPYFSYSQVVQHVSKVAAEAVVFPISNSPIASDFIPELIGKSHQGTFTSASSTFIYNGEAMTEDHQGNVFICESAQNLVQRQIMSENGVSFASALPYEGKEFLASENEWFRPVYVNLGPDGSLYVVDMHRKVIDHPSYVPEIVRDKLDFQSGRDMGRIYAVSAVGKNPSLKSKSWFTSEESVVDLVERLSTGTEWDQQTAFRLLLEQQNIAEAASALQDCAINASLASARVKAMWLLAKHELLTESMILSLLQDPVAGVRAQTILMLESASELSSPLKDALIALAADPSPQVQFRVALLLGQYEDPASTKALAAIALQRGEDQWMRAAILSGIGETMSDFMKSLNAQNTGESKAYPLIMRALANMFGQGATMAECSDLINVIFSSTSTDHALFATVLGLVEGLNGRTDLPAHQNVLRFLGSQLRGVGKAQWPTFLGRVQSQAAEKDLPLETRLNAIQLLGYFEDDQSLAILAQVLKEKQPVEIPIAAIQSISAQGRTAAAALLTKESTWTEFTPQVRSNAISVLVSQQKYIPVLLQAIEQGTIAAADIPSTDRRRLIKNREASIQSKAEAVFSELEGGDRMQVYEKYKALLAGEGHPENGAVIFKRTCAICHTYNGEGGQVGPDLSGIKNQPPDAILLHTIVPNYEVYPTYQTVTIQTKDNRSASGWIVSESDNSITLRIGSGSDETIMRSAIQSLTNTGMSLMPDGLEQTMTEQDMIDLIAYLKQGSLF